MGRNAGDESSLAAAPMGFPARSQPVLVGQRTLAAWCPETQAMLINPDGRCPGLPRHFHHGKAKHRNKMEKHTPSPPSRCRPIPSRARYAMVQDLPQSPVRGAVSDHKRPGGRGQDYRSLLGCNRPTMEPALMMLRCGVLLALQSRANVSRLGDRAPALPCRRRGCATTACSTASPSRRRYCGTAHTNRPSRPNEQCDPPVSPRL